MERYQAEVREKWGKTEAYREYSEKHDSRQETDAIAEGMMEIFREFAAEKNSGAAADSPEVQALVKKLQDYISKHFYRCTDEILAGLGQMYTADRRFRENIDKNGDGTAEFVSKAISLYR